MAGSGNHSRGPWSLIKPDGSTVLLFDENGVFLGAAATANLALTGTLAVSGLASLNGGITIPTAKSAVVTDADGLTVGGKIVPQTFTVQLGQTAYGNVGWIAPFGCKVVSVRERHTTAEATAGSLTAMVKKVASGTAIGAGTDTLAAGINQKGTANTVVTPALHATAANYTLAAGDGLGALLSGSATELAGGTITVELQRV